MEPRNNAVNSTFANFNTYLPIAWEPRPDLSTPWAQKNADYKYDLAVVRSHLGSLSTNYVNFSRVSNMVNEGFASGSLWGLPSDVEGYLKEKGIPTSRPAMVFPMFTPMMSRMLGLLSQVDVYARAESISPEAESRKEKYLNQVLAFSLASSVGPMMQEAFAGMGITGDPNADLSKAERSFRDEVVEAINDYVSVLAKRMKIDQLKYEIGQNLTNGGIAAIHGYYYGDYPAVEPLSMEELIVDQASRRRDLSDSTFIGFRKIRDLSDLMDIHHGSREVLKSLQESMKSENNNGLGGYWPWGKPVEHTVYFKDGKYVTKGFVDGPNGIDLVDVDEVDPDTGKPKYTEADIIEPPQNKYTRGWKGKTNTRFETKLRYCSFLPREYNPQGKEINGEKLGDIVLSHGECEYTETNSDQEQGVSFPIFRCAWMNIAGLIVAPLTAAQTPQRVMNIITSDVVHRLSKAGGRSPVFDKRALAGQNLRKVAIDLKEGDPIQVDSVHAGSVQNVIGYQGEGLDKNIFAEFDLIDKLKAVNESLTHLYDQNFGGSGSANELVGVKRLQWQQTSLAQHPYVEAIRITNEQLYNWLANGARRFLMDRPWAMEKIVGEKGLKVFEALGDMSTEEVKVEVKLSPDASTVRQAVDETVLGQWLPLQLIDPATAAEILGESNVEKALEIMKTFNKDRAEAQAQQAEAQAQAAQMAQFQEQDATLAQQENELYNKMMDIGMKSDQTQAKSEAPIVSNMAKGLAPQETPTA